MNRDNTYTSLIPKKNNEGATYTIKPTHMCTMCVCVCVDKTFI